MMETEDLKLTGDWDKVFPKSEKVDHKKVTFVNHFGITLAADMYIPKNTESRLPAIAVSGPFGACKEQSSGLYAQTMAERGFLTIAFDPSFTGESGGSPRAMHSPDIDVEDFQAAVDFLSVQENVDPERIGIIGICGWGGMALQTACVDTRIKATVTSTMYDMSRVAGNGYFDEADNEEARHEMSGQMKTLLDRLNPLYPSDYRFRKIYLLSTAAEDGSYVPEKALSGLKGWVDCFEKAELAGSLFCGGLTEVGEAETDLKNQEKAYEFGKKLQ